MRFNKFPLLVAAIILVLFSVHIAEAGSITNYWAFDGNVDDSVGSANLSVQGRGIAHLEYVSGQVGQALFYWNELGDGTQLQNLGGMAASIRNNGSTFGGWIKFRGFVNNHTFVAYSKNGYILNVIRYEYTNKLLGYLQTPVGSFYCMLSASPQTDTWYKIHVVYDHSEEKLKCYVGGSLMDETNVTPAEESQPSSEVRFRYGFYNGVAYGTYFDEWIFADFAMSQTQIDAMMTGAELPRFIDALLSWSQNTDPAFASYRLYRSTSPDVTLQSELIVTITDRSQTSYLDQGLGGTQIYFYKVLVFNRAGIFSESNEVNTR